MSLSPSVVPVLSRNVVDDLFAWVPWFQELAKKLADGGPDFLVPRARRIPWNVDGMEAALLRHGDQNIDPFSFLRLLASKNESPHWERVHPTISEQFWLDDWL